MTLETNMDTQTPLKKPKPSECSQTSESVPIDTVTEVIELDADKIQSSVEYQEILKPIKSSGIIATIFVVPLLILALLNASMPGVVFVILFAGAVVSVLRLFLQTIRAGLKVVRLIKKEKSK